MRALRILLTMSIALSVFLGAGVVPATAARGEEVGYIRLLSEESQSSAEFNQGMDIGMARAMIAARSRESFNRILPKLMDAKRSGLILDFKPEFAFGMVRIKYATGANLSSALPGFKVFSEARNAVIKLTAAQNQDVSAALTYHPYFYNEIYGGCFDVYGLLENYRAVIILKNQAGKTLAVDQIIADSTGYGWDCFHDWTGGDARPGLKIIYKIYRPGGSLRSTFSRNVPGGIAITAINKVDSKLSFKGPAGKNYLAYWYHAKLNSTDAYSVKSVTGTIPPSGNVTRDFGTVRIRGGDWLTVAVTFGRFNFWRGMYAPSVDCYINDDYCSLFGFAFKPASITVVQGSKSYTISGRFNYWGGFEAYFTNAAGLPLMFKPGDKVSGTGVKPYILPNLTANIVYTTDVAKGKAPKSRFFRLWLYDITTDMWYSRWTSSNTLGNYKEDFTSEVDLTANKPYYVEIWYVDKATGNGTDAYFPIAP